MSAIEDAYVKGWIDGRIHEEEGYEERNARAAEHRSKIEKTAVRIIFLDIDGVLNNYLEREGHRQLSDRCVGLLNRLTDETGAKIVLSSTWRLGKSLEEIQVMAKDLGITGEVIGRTEDLRGKHPSIVRGNEIDHWINTNTDIIGDKYVFRNYVILDDDCDMLYFQRNNYVNCDPAVGITERTVFKAKAILLNKSCEDVYQEV